MPATACIVKNYSECQGAERLLLDTGLFVDTGETCVLGHATAPVLQLTDRGAPALDGTR